MKRILSKLILILVVMGATTLLAVCNDAHVCKFEQQVVNDEYLFSQATCESCAMYYYSCTCGVKNEDVFEYGDCLGHDYGEWISNQDGTHSKICSNDDRHIIIENCSGGTATIQNKPICTHCNQPYGACLPHTHEYNKQVTTSEYLYLPATCTSSAIYYYSCECGQKGIQAFEYGDALGHNYSSCVSNGDGTHTKICLNNINHREKESCSGGTATETSKAVCSQCKTPYGEVLVHVHDYNQQAVEYKYLYAQATCESAETYYYSCECGEEGKETFTNGNALGHNYVNCTPNSNGTHTKTCANDGTHTITENCSGGTATETKKAVCEFCHVEYGETLNQS